MKIIGIDPGTARMGVGVISVNKSGKSLKVHKTDVIVTPAETDMHLRLQILYLKVTDYVKKHKPDIMVIERLFFNTNAKTAMTVGQARGVAMLVAADNSLPLAEYTALEAKRLITGYGRADKKQMQSAVKDLLDLKEIIKSDDANDALAMALCHIIKSYGDIKQNR